VPDIAAKPKARRVSPWIVHHRDGWCALPEGAEPDPQALNDPTLCGYVINLRGGSKHGTPDCPECLAILYGSSDG
jgi:hypothetical protein